MLTQGLKRGLFSVAGQWNTMTNTDDPEQDSELLDESTKQTAQYQNTAILGALVFIVLPAAYYFIGLRAAALVALSSLFLVVYFNQL